MPLFQRAGPIGDRAATNLRQRLFAHGNCTRECQFRDAESQPSNTSLQNRLWWITLQYHHWLFDLAEAAVQIAEALGLRRRAVCAGDVVPVWRIGQARAAGPGIAVDDGAARQLGEAKTPRPEEDSP